MTCTFMEVWAGPRGDGCYLQVRDGQVVGCWIGRKGRKFASIEAGRKWLADNEYKCVISWKESVNA